MPGNSVRTVRYLLEIYDAHGEQVFQVESAMPFGTISAGDDLRADNVSGFAADMVEGKVKSVKHFMQGASDTAFLHMVMVHLS